MDAKDSLSVFPQFWSVYCDRRIRFRVAMCDRRSVDWFREISVQIQPYRCCVHNSIGFCFLLSQFSWPVECHPFVLLLANMRPSCYKKTVVEQQSIWQKYHVTWNINHQLLFTDSSQALFLHMQWMPSTCSTQPWIRRRSWRIGCPKMGIPVGSRGWESPARVPEWQQCELAETFRRVGCFRVTATDPSRLIFLFSCPE